MSGFDNMEIIQDVPDMKAVPHILSPAVRLGDTLYLSGQTPIDGSGKVVDGDIEELTEWVFLKLCYDHARGYKLITDNASEIWKRC